MLHTDALNHNADFIIVDETWFTEKQRDADVSLPGFNLFRSDRKSRIGGGVCIYVHSKYQDCNIIHSTPLVSNLEILWLQCTIQGILYYIACCYHPPKLRYPSSQYCDQLSADVQILIASVRVQDLQCGTYVNFQGLARVAIQGLTWVNF